jgi:hypothetical protein
MVPFVVDVLAGLRARFRRGRLSAAAAAYLMRWQRTATHTVADGQVAGGRSSVATDPGLTAACDRFEPLHGCRNREPLDAKPPPTARQLFADVQAMTASIGGCFTAGSGARSYRQRCPEL